MNTVLANQDSYLGMGKNYYIYLDPKTQKLNWIPWDMDLSMGGFFLSGTAQERINLSIDKPSSMNDPLLERLLSMPEIREQYRKLIADCVERQFEPDGMCRRIDELSALIRPAVMEEGTTSEIDFERSIDGTRPAVSRKRWMVLEPALKDFVRGRYRSIQGQLAGKVRGDTPRFR